MSSYIVKRLLSLIPTLFVVSFVVFFLIYIIPGGPAASMLGLEATKEQIQELNSKLGFDRPFPVQYADWLKNILAGDWGDSFFLRQSVLSAIMEYFGPTISLSVLAQLIAVLIAIPCGILSACKRGSVFDGITTIVVLVGIAVPGFLLSLFLMLFFGVYLKLLPVAGYVPLKNGIGEHLYYLILPAFSLGIIQAAYITRMTRNTLLDILNEDYVKTLRGMGISKGKLIFKYALKNASPTLLTVVGQSFGSLMTGAIVTERLFQIAGLGQLTMSAIRNRDIFVIQGVVLFVTLLYILINLTVDVLYGIIDPRIKQR